MCGGIDDEEGVYLTGALQSEGLAPGARTAFMVAEADLVESRFVEEAIGVDPLPAQTVFQANGILLAREGADLHGKAETFQMAGISLFQCRFQNLFDVAGLFDG